MRNRILQVIVLILVALGAGLLLGLAFPHLLGSGDRAGTIRLELTEAMDRACAGLPEQPPQSRSLGPNLDLIVGELPSGLRGLDRLRDGIHHVDDRWVAVRTLPVADRAFLIRESAGESPTWNKRVWFGGLVLVLLLLAWLLWNFIRIMRPFTRVPDLLDADPADLARRIASDQPRIGELLGLESAREPIAAIEGALEELEREPVPRGPVEEIRAATRNVESMMEAVIAVGSGDLPVMQRPVPLRPRLKEAMARHDVDQLTGGAAPELKLPAKVIELVLDRMLEGAGDQARVEIEATRIRVVNCHAEPQAFGWNLATDLVKRYRGDLRIIGRTTEWVFAVS